MLMPKCTLGPAIAAKVKLMNTVKMDSITLLCGCVLRTAPNTQRRPMEMTHNAMTMAASRYRVSREYRMRMFFTVGMFAKTQARRKTTV